MMDWCGCYVVDLVCKMESHIRKHFSELSVDSQLRFKIQILVDLELAPPSPPLREKEGGVQAQGFLIPLCDGPTWAESD
jgi:hypothetical protein